MSRDVWAYNLDNNRPDQQQLQREVDAILDTGPLALVCVERLGNTLRERRGYDLLASDKNRSRQNTAIYVAADAEHGDLRWIDLDTTWHRTEGPGEHEARSFPHVDVDGLLLIGVHQQPKGTNTTLDGQAEGIGALSRAFREHDGPALAIGDFNRTALETGPGPRTLAKRVEGRTIGTRIDCAVGRGVRGRIAYPTSVGGVRLLSDHRRAVRVTIDF